MKEFDKRAFASKLPTLGIVIPDQDLFQNGSFYQKFQQVRAFTKGQEYRMTRKLNEHDIIVIDNEGIEHQLGEWRKHFTYKETGLPITNISEPMTPYEIKDTERAISQFEKIKKDSEEKRANAEAELIKEARNPTNRFYFDRLKETIWQETEHMNNANKQINIYKAKLISAGVNC